MTERNRSSPRPRLDDRESRADAHDTIYTAVELLQAKHEVLQTSAYMILVQAAVDARMTVRDTAARIVAEARGTG